MGRILAIACIVLTGCCWFQDEAPAPDDVVIPARDEAVKAITMPSLANLHVTPELVAKSVDTARQTVDLVNRTKDAAADRVVKVESVTDLSKVAAYAVGLGFLAFLASGVLPIPGLRATALWTIGIGAAISVLGPWLSDVLGDDNVRYISYAAFGIVALSASVGLGWYIIDKVKDETEHDDGKAS